MYIQTAPATFGLIIGGGALHFRIAALNGAGLLANLLTIPRFNDPNNLEVRTPKAVYLAIEAGGATTGRYTVDGQAASATLGFAIPTEPSYVRINVPEAIRNTGTNATTNPMIALFTSGATNLQVLFEL